MEFGAGEMRKSEELGVKAEWYEKQRSAEHVLVVGEMNEPQPLPGEVRIRVAFSGVNPGDVKKREDEIGRTTSSQHIDPFGKD
jgi:NADPH2:quinone reductase